ncbi:hypothetical protein HYH03_002576 [Edaphochlamys debaryana]|uniref:Uncharacterized protein n=1 Tax=Edaphochlamys debaryana TaxID=47281 RepID=A0A835YB25_9CHLO|nr:hypothetical protein HYH03_002576 [Edaphochlamys debaryana]|eukprot:KAG2499637.1 hypothetical protein HYH03_002576 [Edaphochlamys debaryana]
MAPSAPNETITAAFAAALCAALVLATLGLCLFGRRAALTAEGTAGPESARTGGEHDVEAGASLESAGMMDTAAKGLSSTAVPGTDQGGNRPARSKTAAAAKPAGPPSPAESPPGQAAADAGRGRGGGRQGGRGQHQRQAAAAGPDREEQGGGGGEGAEAAAAPGLSQDTATTDVRLTPGSPASAAPNLATTGSSQLAATVSARNLRASPSATSGNPLYISPITMGSGSAAIASRQGQGSSGQQPPFSTAPASANTSGGGVIRLLRTMLGRTSTSSPPVSGANTLQPAGPSGGVAPPALELSADRSQRRGISDPHNRGSSGSQQGPAAGPLPAATAGAVPGVAAGSGPAAAVVPATMVMGSPARRPALSTPVKEAVRASSAGPAAAGPGRPTLSEIAAELDRLEGKLLRAGQTPAQVGRTPSNAAQAAAAAAAAAATAAGAVSPGPTSRDLRPAPTEAAGPALPLQQQTRRPSTSNLRA